MILNTEDAITATSPSDTRVVRLVRERDALRIRYEELWRRSSDADEAWIDLGDKDPKSSRWSPAHSRVTRRTMRTMPACSRHASASEIAWRQSPVQACSAV